MNWYWGRYIAGHPEFIGSKSVVIWVNEDGLVIHKKPLIYGKGDLLFKIPYSKVIFAEGDGSKHPSDSELDLSTLRRLTVTVSGEDAKGNKCDVPIAFDIGKPWESIPKIIGLINKQRGVKI